MTKRLRLKDEKSEDDEKLSKNSCENSENHSSFLQNQIGLADLFEKYGENCVIMGDLPSDTIENDLHEFLSKQSEIKYFWLEDTNGKETRQAIVCFSSNQELKKIIGNQSSIIFKSSLVFVEKCNKELMDITEKYIQLISLKNQNYKMRATINEHVNNGIIFKIDHILESIYQVRIKFHENNGNWPQISTCDLLLTKFSCYILQLAVNNTLQADKEA